MVNYKPLKAKFPFSVVPTFRSLCRLFSCRGFFGEGQRLALLLLGTVLLLSASFTNVGAQSKPVTVITSLTPPYTPFLGEYANDITDKLRVTLVLHDSRVESYPVKLIMSLEQVGYGEVMRTTAYASTPAFYIDNGSVTLGGADLASLFLPSNLEFFGGVGQSYINTGRIPDGLYRLGFSVVDAMRPDVVLASTGFSAPSWFTLNQPPLLSLPVNNEEVARTDIQNVRFSWTPRHLSSGNTAFAIEYLFQLYEMRVAGVGKDQTVLSTLPVYATTTTSTSLFLTDGDYLLEQGVSYVWRVTADDGVDGFTLFENGGLSETRAFTYGCLCPVPEAPLPYTVTSEKAVIEWQPDPLHMSFETRFRRRNDPEGLWHTRESYLGEVNIDKVLETNTSYEFQVRARCFNGEQSDYSPLNWFTTTDIERTGIECGKADVMAAITNFNPKPMLYAGEVIGYGDWQLVLTEVVGGNGIFSGKCTVSVPLFNYARVNMVFDNIRVNELNQVTEGIVRSEYNDDSRMMIEDITDYFGEGDQIGNIIDNVAVAELALDFAAGDGLTASVSTNGTTVTLTSAGNSQTFTVENIDEGTTVKDTQGNIYAVTSTGETTLIGKDLATKRGEGDTDENETFTIFDGARTSETLAPDKPSPFSANLSFVDVGKWALDYWDEQYDGSPFNEEYTLFNDVHVPWKMVPKGKSDKLRVTVAGLDLLWAPANPAGDPGADPSKDPGADPSTDPAATPGKIRFITATGTEFFAKRDGSSYDLEVLGGGERDGYELLVVLETSAQEADTPPSETSDVATSSTSNYVVLGKINIASYPLIERSVIVVPMAGAIVDGAALESALDGIFSRYGVNWNVRVDDPFTDTSWDSGIDGLKSGGSGFFSVYTDEMRALNTAYVAQRGVEENTVYLFWFAGAAGDNAELAGDMPLDSPFGYIFASTAGASVYTTAAHELGHGTFQLRHTFSDTYSLPKYSTDNLMDYSGGTTLVKYQWDLLHDPRTMVARWIQSEEEGEAIIPVMDFIDFTELEIDFSSFKGDIQGTLTFMTPGGYPIVLPNTYKFCFNGITNNNDLNSLISLGVLTGFKDENNITYVGSFKKSEGKWSFTGYKTISVAEIEYYQYSDEQIDQLPEPCLLTVGIEIPNECAIYIGTIEYSGIDRSIDPTQTTDINSGFDYTKYNIPVAATHTIGNCFLPPEVSSLTLASCAELFVNQAWAKYNVYGDGGMLFKYDIEGTEYFVYSNVKENGDSYYYVYDTEVGQWRPYVPPDLQSLLNSIKFLVNPQVVKKIVNDYGHETLDLIGFVPVIGEGFDLLNGFWYYIEGERGQGILSMSAALPIVGWISDGSKWIWKGAKQVGKTVKMADGALEFVSVADNAIDNITAKINTLNLPVEKVDALAADLGNSQEFVSALSNNTELIVPWDALSSYSILRKNPDNLVVLDKIKNKFSYNGKSGYEALGEIFTNHSSVQQFIDNLNKYDEIFSGVDGLSVTGIKSSSEARILLNNKVIGVIGSSTDIGNTQLWSRFVNINKKIPDNLLKKLGELPDGGNKFLSNFVGATDETLQKFLDKPELVDAWKKMEDLGADEALKQNVGALEVLDYKAKGEFNKILEPSEYLDADYIKNHLEKFDDGAIRFTTDAYPTLGTNEAFVMPKSEFDDLMIKTGGNLSLIEIELSLKDGTLTGKNAVIAWIKKEDLINLKMPKGDEVGADANKWIPGGKTANGGWSEAVIDLSNPSIPKKLYPF